MTQLSGTQSSAFRDTLLFHPTGTHLHNTLSPAVCVSLPLHVEQNRRSNVFGGSSAWKSSTCPCNGNHPADTHFSDCQQIWSAHSAPLWAAPRAVDVTCRSPSPTLLRRALWMLCAHRAESTLAEPGCALQPLRTRVCACRHGLKTNQSI